MPCGTGKSLMAMWAAEENVGAGGTVLYLVPSIALMGQTMREWARHRGTGHVYVGVCSDKTTGHRSGDGPVGELMFWNSAGDDDGRTIGSGAKTKTATAKIVDGQQRLTSLYAVMTGEPVVDDEYRSESIKIAFNPITVRFEVQSAALAKSREWVPDISAVFKSPFQAKKAFISRYREEHDLSEADEEEIEAVFAQLRANGLGDQPNHRGPAAERVLARTGR